MDTPDYLNYSDEHFGKLPTAKRALQLCACCDWLEGVQFFDSVIPNQSDRDFLLNKVLERARGSCPRVQVYLLEKNGSLDFDILETLCSVDNEFLSEKMYEQCFGNRSNDRGTVLFHLLRYRAWRMLQVAIEKGFFDNADILTLYLAQLKRAPMLLKVHNVTHQDFVNWNHLPSPFEIDEAMKKTRFLVPRNMNLEDLFKLKDEISFESLLVILDWLHVKPNEELLIQILKGRFDSLEDVRNAVHFCSRVAHPKILEPYVEEFPEVLEFVHQCMKEERAEEKSKSKQNDETNEDERNDDDDDENSSDEHNYGRHRWKLYTKWKYDSFLDESPSAFLRSSSDSIRDLVQRAPRGTDQQARKDLFRSFIE